MTGRRLRELPALGLIGVSVLVAWMSSAVASRVRIPQVAARAAPPRAEFSHVEHGQLQCYTCHPSVFPQAPLGFTHAEMRQRRYCGACHDGSAAKSIGQIGCEDCHARQ